MTFVAFGALSMAAAMPANADTVLYGSAVANVTGHEIVLEATQQGAEDSASENVVFEPESYLSVDADASTRVDADGVHSSVVVNSAHAQLTMDDILDLIEAENTDLLSSGGDAEALAAEDSSTEDEADDDLEEETEEEADEEDVDEEGEADEDAEEEVDEEAGEEADEQGSEADEARAPNEPGTQDEAGTTDEHYFLDVEFTDASVSVTKGWDGEYSASFEPGEVIEHQAGLPIDIATYAEDGAAEFDDFYDEDITWDGAYNSLYASFDAGDIWLDFHFADAIAGTADLVPDEHDNGDNGDDKDNGKDDGKKEEDDSGKGDDKPAPNDQADEQLAVTGGALSGLVAAALAAVGAGGAGLYFARRRKASLATADEA